MAAAAEAWLLFLVNEHVPTHICTDSISSMSLCFSFFCLAHKTQACWSSATVTAATATAHTNMVCLTPKSRLMSRTTRVFKCGWTSLDLVGKCEYRTYSHRDCDWERESNEFSLLSLLVTFSLVWLFVMASWTIIIFFYCSILLVCTHAHALCHSQLAVFFTHWEPRDV